MKKVLVVVTVVIAVLIALPLVSRIARGPIPPADSAHPRSTSDSQGRGVANEAITLWSQSRNEDALSLLLEGKRPDSAPGPLIECLSISEAQFVQLPTAQQPAIAQQFQQAANAARELSRAAIARIQGVRDDRAKAALWTSRLKDFAGQLSGPEYSQILQLVGQRIEKNVAQ